MSYLTKLSLRNRSLIALATIAILLIGAFVIPTLKEELFPSLEFPAISVVSVYPGASPSIVEQDVTNPLEQSIQGLQGIQQTTSYSSQNSSVIVVEYNYGTDLNAASQTLTQQINRAEASLPSGVTPQVQTFNINDLPVIQLAVTSSENMPTLATDINSEIVPSLQGINGVANVNVTGVRNQIVTVTLDLSKLQKEGVTVTQVQGVLQANNVTIPAGELTNNGQTLAIRVGNTFNSVQDLQNVVVGEHVTTVLPPGCPPLTTGTGASTSFGGASLGGATTPTSACTPKITATPIALKDVATVQQTLAPSTTLTRTNGKDSLGISITKTPGGNTVSVSQQVQQMLPSLESKLGHSAQITVVSDQAPMITSAVSSLVREGLIGAAFAILVILLFLFSLRSMLVTAVSIPLSVVIALIALYIGNYSLNILTLGGLTIAVGRVVDDSIVVLENIYRHLRSGEEKQAAVLNAVKEVAGAVTASTLTTVSVFLPIAFVGGLVGELFSSFAIAVTVALLASLLVALTVIPVLAYWFLKAPRVAQQGATKPSAPAQGNWVERGYLPLVRWTTGHRAITIIAAVVIFAGSIALVPRLGTNLFSQTSQNTYSVSMTLPVGTSLNATNTAAQKVEAMLNGLPHVQAYQVTVGSGGSSFSSLSGGSGGDNNATFAVTSDPNADQTAFQQTLQNRLNALTGVGTLSLSASNGGLNASTIDVNVQSSNQQTLRQAAQQVLNAVKQVPDTSNVSSNLTDTQPLINVQVDPQKALTYGLTAAQVGQSLREVYTGLTVTTVTFNNQQLNVNLLLGSPANTIDAMDNLLIPTQTGTVKLSAIASVTQIEGPTQITHVNGVQTATISATASGQNVGAISLNIQNKINKLSLPGGVTVSLGGVTSDQSQAFSNLELALLVAILLVYLVMVVAFRSLLQPLILLVSIPFAGTGSILLLLATRTALGAPSLLGLLMLVGIVVTNAIVLLDLINQYRKKGLDVRSAVMEGARHRVRPILMTAVATILALTPMALGLSPSSGFIAAPLALTVIGGLTTSTVLTLLLVPTLYVMFESRRDRSSKNGKQPVQNIVTQETLPLEAAGSVQ
ncbi:MAG: efflux RND transporter permease subunit [Ktedonobacteraceae bacterium]